MAHKDRDVEVQSGERPSERRHRSKSEKDPKDPNRKHKSSRSSRPKVIDPETGEVIKTPHRSRREKDSEKRSEASSSMADLVPELARTASAPGATSRGSLPYPSFNKAHSKEAVNSREDFKLPTKAKPNVYTPESTDLGSEDKPRSKSAEHFSPSRGATTNARPPSPPETEFSQQRKGTPSRMSKVREEVETESRPSSRTSIRKEKELKPREADRDDQSKVSKASKASTAIKSPRMVPDGVNPFGDSNAATDLSAETRQSTVDSNVTSVAPKRVPQPLATGRPPNLDTDSSPESAQDSSPRTPTQTPQFPPPDLKSTPSPFIHFDAPDSNPSEYSPQPPPPPPPPNVPINIPRVDYLLNNGGLLRPAPKTLLSVPPPINPQYNVSRAATPMPPEIERIFGPFYNTLDQYETVIAKNGSIAVATGYRSVARRLLDRLENVFNRDLSSEGCNCIMCEHSDQSTYGAGRGLGWGEVLEWVGGRRDLPQWPAFDFASLGVKAGEELAGIGLAGPRNPGDGIRPGSPIKIDPDVAEEYREHYLAQSKKTKTAVNKWLSSCPETAAAPPQEVDDETLSFAILTHLDQHDRPIFNALLTGSSVLQPVSRAPTPLRKPRTDFMMKTVQALQQLYRLPVPPRDPEAAIYLLRNPELHNLLATMSNIHQSEWEILTSGRFDGFLWSGAEDSTNPSPAPSRGPTPANGNRGPPTPAMRQASRTNTPFSPLRNQTFSPSIASSGYPSRGPTPFNQSKNPVSNDEETEIAVLAEIEREIYLGMEALEDAFEGLHRKAEYVRRALRERGAGLSMSLQSRRSSLQDPMRFGTPGLGVGYERPTWGEQSELSESDWDPTDEQSEIAPDDSASNISSSRHRRPKRRTERRTPAPVEEEDEE
ncbi:hypothetical protein GLAREA_08005 [Glarea lozoyensis ATCC 20868]|uniref:5-Methylcytosine G/T mismatch-specific DNA glycosylase n=1 Tax=Glarea lozoyensis (strain ATCC 20868 / MF5171) TaxID=1116229 RepID=S3CDR5_GLAL2|nr:uncharacterized protein GLAREA_08005 [Glarea lozoyensis ATCC 20868]EPE24155.1 hypothetical protein GLAREA_08005 [Glarea lozoyensis ATCC 20868]